MKRTISRSVSWGKWIKGTDESPSRVLCCTTCQPDSRVVEMRVLVGQCMRISSICYVFLLSVYPTIWGKGKGMSRSEFCRVCLPSTLVNMGQLMLGLHLHGAAKTLWWVSSTLGPGFEPSLTTGLWCLCCKLAELFHSGCF